MNIQDRKKTFTAEDLRRRYNLDELNKDRKAIKQNGKDIESVGALLNNFAEITTRNIEELQDQVDGNITTWFYNGVPTLSNLPASEWATNTDKDKHIGDLYYDQNTGYAYRFQKTNNVYSWLKLTDSDITEALAIANAAQDTADSKRRVFVVQPIPPYDIGDIWIKEDKDLYRCKTAVAEGGSYSQSHWILATDYTNDTVALEAKAELNQYKDTVAATYTSKSTFETTIDSIQSDITSIYTDYSTTTQMNSSINQKIADNNTAYVDIEVGKKVNNTDYTNANITAKINDGTSTVQINANKISLAGKTIDLTTDSIIINSTNFQVDVNGNITANSGTYKGNISIASDEYEITPQNYKINVYNTSSLLNAKLYPDYLVFSYNDSKTSNRTLISRDIVVCADNDYLNGIGRFCYMTSNWIRAVDGTTKDQSIIAPDEIKITNNTTHITTSIKKDNITTPSITAGNIDCGSGTCSSSGYTQIYFNKTFSSAPNVVCTPNTYTNGVIAIKIANITTTGFEATLGGTGFGNENFNWIAMN